MENFKLQKYVNEKRIAGLSDKQIATSLGMSLEHLNTLLGKKEPIPKSDKNDPPVARVGMSFVASGMKAVPVGGVIDFAPKDTKTSGVTPSKPEDVNPIKPGEKEAPKDQKHGWIDSET